MPADGDRRGRRGGLGGALSALSRGIDQVSVDTGALAQNLRFPGQWFQAETGLHQNWMRDYDPTTGRYLQADPLGLVDGASVYGYARQSPVVHSDPNGEKTLAVGGAGDATTGIVKAVAALHDWEYFSHLDQARLQARIIELAAKNESGECPEDVKVLGHSWGGETAALAAKGSGGAVDLLVTVHPISGWSWPHPAGIAKRWINIYPLPGSKNLSDYIADLGTNPGEADGIHPRFKNADRHIAVPGANHADFYGMLTRSGVIGLLD